MQEYTFEMMWEDLNNGYQIYYTFCLLYTSDAADEL